MLRPAGISPDADDWRLNATTVFDDQTVDTLTGDNGSPDWFFDSALVPELLKKKSASEIVTTI